MCNLPVIPSQLLNALKFCQITRDDLQAAANAWPAIIDPGSGKKIVPRSIGRRDALPRPIRDNDHFAYRIVKGHRLRQPHGLSSVR